MRMRAATPVIAAAALAAFAGPALADTLEMKGRFDHWTVFVRDRPGDKICYAVSKPRTWEPGEAGEAPAWLYISTFLGDGERGQISITAGADMDSTKPATIEIKGERFELQTHGRRAYAKDGNAETALRRAIARGTVLKVEVPSRKGNVLEYLYSLRGSAAAITHAREQCK
jgi:hypothetical protein